MVWNNFGLTEAKIVAMFPNADALDFGIAGTIDDAIGRAVQDVLDLMPERIYRLFTERVELEIMVGPASGAEVSYTLGLGKLAKVNVDSMRAYVQAMDDRFIKPDRIPTYLEDNYTNNITLSGGNNEIATFLAGTVQKNNFYMITYEIDPETITSFPGAARIAQYRTAFELGSMLYTSEEETTWQLVTDYGQLADRLFDDLKEGKIIFDSVRTLRFAKDIMPATSEMSVVKKYRA